jgi:hypothetical protein
MYINLKVQTHYTFLIKMFIYNIMKTQCEHVNKNMNYSMRLFIIVYNLHKLTLKSLNFLILL